MKRSLFNRFIYPDFSLFTLLRIAFIIVCAWVFFSQICIPIRLAGASMEPGYADGGINFIWRPAYYFSPPERHDAVGVRFAGRRVMLLKRVVAFEGEVVEFRGGVLYVDGEELYEPYVEFPCDWELAPRRVKRGNVYVIGDNRDIDIDRHVFGQTPLERLMGVPLW